MLPGGGIGPLSENSWRREADEERPPPGAVNVAGDPVSALPAAVGEISPADLFGARAKRGGDGGGRAHDARAGSEAGPAKPGLWAWIGSMEASLGTAGGTPRCRLLSGSRRRRGGGRRAARAPRRPAGWVSGRTARKKGRPRAVIGAGAAPLKKGGGGSGWKVPAFPNIRVRRRRRPGDEIALNEHRGGGWTDLVPIVDLAGSLPIFTEMHDVVVRTIRCGVVDTTGDRADVFAVNDDRAFVVAGTAERDVTGAEIATGHGGLRRNGARRAGKESPDARVAVKKEGRFRARIDAEPARGSREGGAR